MRIIAKRTLREFWDKPNHTDSKASLEAWHSEVLKATWLTPQHVKEQFRNASILKNNRIVLNIAGNKYRLIVSVDYDRQVIYIRFIGTHRQYDQIDAEVI